MTAKLEVTGNIAQPELKFANSGTPYIKFSLADTPRKKDPQTGEWFDDGETMWLSCTLWGVDAEHYSSQLAKGSRVTVYGTLTVRGYQTQSGETRQSLDVRVNALQVHEARQDRQQPRQSTQPGYGQPTAGYGAPAPQNGSNGFGNTTAQNDPWGQAQDSPPF